MVGAAGGLFAGRLISRGIGDGATTLDGKTAQALAKVFGEDPKDLQGAWNTFKSITGRPPSMAAMASLKESNLIAGAAKNSTPIVGALRDAYDANAAARSGNMSATLAPEQGAPATEPLAAPTQAGASSAEIANARTAQGDIDYPASRATEPFAISTAPSDALGGETPADHFANDILPLAGLGKADRVRVMSGLKEGTLSAEDAQTVRSGLSSIKDPSPAERSAKASLDDLLHAPGNEAPAAALDTAAANSAATAQRAAGAAHGETITGGASADNFAATASSKANANPNFTAGMATGASSRLADEASSPSGSLALARSFATDAATHAKLTTALGGDAADAYQRMGQAEV
ncbi:MAG: hypothetical protein ACREQ5_25970, partial [Candidatus Dormibacteria bacterium]